MGDNGARLWNIQSFTENEHDAITRMSLNVSGPRSCSIERFASLFGIDKNHLHGEQRRPELPHGSTRLGELASALGTSVARDDESTALQHERLVVEFRRLGSSRALAESVSLHGLLREGHRNGGSREL